MPELNDAPNYTSMFAGAYLAGRDQAREKGIQNALSMNASDPQGAQNALIQYGAIPEANALAQNSAAQRSLAARQAAGAKFAAGDAQGAQATAAGAGDFDTAAAIAKMTDEQRSQAAHVADVTNSALFGLSQLPQAQRMAGLQKITPTLLQQGVGQDAIDHAAQSGLTDDFLKATAATTMSVKEQIASHQKDTELTNQKAEADARLAQSKAEFGETQRSHRVNESIAAQNAHTEAARAASSQIQVLQDRDGTPYTYNAATRTATTLDGKPYAPTGAQKLGSSNPRSAVAMATQRFMQEHPDATAEDLADFNANVGKKAKAAKDFATGKQGQTVNSLNVGISHLSALQDYADALQNGNVQLLNQAGNAVKTQLGVAAPTNFNAAKQIVGDEVVKAIVGAGGTGGDREKAQSIISAASSPAQLSGAIKTVKTLMAGQLHGLRLQYKTSVGADDFESHLTPEAARELEAIPVDAPTPAPLGGKGGGKPSLQSIFGR